MDLLIAPVYFVCAHQFLGTAAFLVLGYYAVRLLSRSSNALGQTIRSYGFVFLLVATLLKAFFGHGLAVHLVHWVGQEAHGVVLDEYATATVYNNQRVYGSHVLLALANGRTVEESFRTDAFNVYPPHNQTTYPTQGERFDARYLQHFPSAFIILQNEGGEFAQDLRCDEQQRALRAAEVKHQFAPENRAFTNELLNALQHYLDTHCEVTPAARDEELQELQKLQQERR